jgi:hypothetical protein
MFLCIISIVLNAFVYSADLPPLKWKIPLSDLPSYSSVQIDLSDSTFLFGNAVVSRRDGTVISTINEFEIKNNSRTAQGGFVVTEGDRIIVLNNSFEPERSIETGSIPLLSAIQTGDGGYVALSGSNQLIRTDAKGTILHDIQINGLVHYPPDSINNTDEPVDIHLQGICNLGEDIVVYGRSHPMYQQNIDSWLIKFDINGKEVWKTLLGGVEIIETVSCENSLVLSGNIDYNGWQVIQQSPSTQALRKRNYFPTMAVPVIEIGPDGTIIMHEDFSSTSYCYGQSLSMSDSGFILGYYAYEPPVFDDKLTRATIVSVDRSGQILWSESYENTHLSATEVHNRPLRAQTFSSGGIAIAALDTLYYHDAGTRVHPAVNNANKSQAIINNVRRKEKLLLYTVEKASDIRVSYLSLNGRQIATTGLLFHCAGSHSLPIPSLGYCTYLVSFTTNRKERTVIRMIR